MRTRQILLLNEKGVLLESCDTLFDTNKLKNQSLTMDFPFLESVFYDLMDRLESDILVTFPGVETKHEFLPGYYDYTFRVINSNGCFLIQWEILDATEKYQEIKKRQQSFNEQSATKD